LCLYAQTTEKPPNIPRRGLGKGKERGESHFSSKDNAKNQKTWGTYHPGRREPVQEAEKSHILMALLAIWIDV
jgi:hypothetical protein